MKNVLEIIWNFLKELADFFWKPVKVLAQIFVLVLAIVLALFACAQTIKSQPKVDDHWAYKTNLISLHLDQSHTTQGSIKGESAGSIFGSAGYVSGQVDGKPTLYMYIRYKDEHGATVDKLLPRDKVSLHEDAPDQQGYVEFKGTWERTATKQEFRDNKHKKDSFAKEERADDTASPRPCFTNVEDCWDGASKDDREVDVIVHIPAGSVIPEVDPNTIHK